MCSTNHKDRYIDKEKSGYLAHHGSTEQPSDVSSLAELQDVRSREAQYSMFPPPRLARTQSAASRRSNGRPINEVSGVPVNEEKGRDIHLVTWYGEDDSENVSQPQCDLRRLLTLLQPRNWSLFKRCFVTFQICLLTTSVYVGSSIYTSGEQSVIATFGVSQVAATLGLTLFVAGYGLGPMV